MPAQRHPLGRLEQAPGHRALPDALRLNWVAESRPGGQACCFQVQGSRERSPTLTAPQMERMRLGYTETFLPGNLEPQAGDRSHRLDAKGCARASLSLISTSACLVFTWQGHTQGLLGADGLLRELWPQQAQGSTRPSRSQMEQMSSHVATPSCPPRKVPSQLSPGAGHPGLRSTHFITGTSG